MIPKVTRVTAKPNYELYVTFYDAGTKLFDMKPYLNKGIFKELQNEKYFKKVRVIWGGIEWPHEQDLSAETLYSRGILVKRSNKHKERTQSHFRHAA